MSRCGNASRCWLQSAYARKVRRHANGTAPIASDSSCGAARRDCGSFASAGSSRRTLQIPRAIRRSIKRDCASPTPSGIPERSYSRARWRRRISTWKPPERPMPRICPCRRRVPVSHRKPATSIELLIVMGTPCRGPSGFREATASSACFASRLARSSSMETNALSLGSRRRMRRKCASTTSAHENCRSRIPLAIFHAGIWVAALFMDAGKGV